MSAEGSTPSKGEAGHKSGAGSTMTVQWRIRCWRFSTKLLMQQQTVCEAGWFEGMGAW